MNIAILNFQLNLLVKPLKTIANAIIAKNITKSKTVYFLHIVNFLSANFLF